MHVFQLYAAGGVLLITLLAVNVSRLRMRERIGNGDGGNRSLKAAIRAHMNALEHTLPVGLLVLALVQLQFNAAALAVFAGGFIAVRVGHAFSMLSQRFRLRQWTAGLSYLFELSGCVLVFAQFL